MDSVVVMALVVLNLLCAALAYRVQALTRGGALTGAGVGILILGFLQARGWLLLVTFVFLGIVVTHVGRQRKTARGLGEGRRNARQVLANGGVAAAAAVLAASGAQESAFVLAFAAALAAAAADTVGSEIGQLAQGRPRLVTTWAPVPVGTDGGVSFLGTLSGVLAAALVAAVGVATGLLTSGSGALVTLAGALGSWVDSVLGATVERRGLLDNDGVNTLATLSAAVLAFFAHPLL